MRASIRRSINNSYEAVAEDGRNYTLRIKGKLLKTEKWEYNPIAVGDVVDFIPHSENEGLIMKRCERKSQFTRFLNKVSLNQTVVANMDQAVIMMAEEENYIILDVRRADEFAAGHIPGAVNIPNESIGTEEIPQLPDKDQLILVYCRSGNRSKQAAGKLANLGYTNIVEFGGILDWTGETVTE